MKFSSSVRASLHGRHAGECPERGGDELRRASRAGLFRRRCGSRRSRGGEGRTDPCRRSAARRCRTCRRASRACRRARRPAPPGLPEARRPRNAASSAVRSPPRPPADSLVVLRVVAAHQALQLGKFADHVGGQVGLGELRGARAHAPDPRRSCRRAPPTASTSRDDAVELRSELVVIDDRSPAAARAPRAGPCGPGRRRTGHPRAARAAPARCRR